MARRSSGSEVCAEVRLAMTLRYLAGGSMWWDIRLIFNISVNEFLKVVFPIDDEEKLIENYQRIENLKGLTLSRDGHNLWKICRRTAIASLPCGTDSR